jgi:hypothetical protein
MLFRPIQRQSLGYAEGAPIQCEPSYEKQVTHGSIWSNNTVHRTIILPTIRFRRNFTIEQCMYQYHQGKCSQRLPSTVYDLLQRL